MFNERVSFEQAVRYLTLDEVLEIACNLHPPLVVDKLDDATYSPDAPTLRTSRAA